jgi:sugar/nucleoside kinase (ribokinase family)
MSHVIRMGQPEIFVIGNVSVDLIMGPQQPWPATGTEVILDHSELRAGGAAGNVALALKALGAPLTLVTNAGNDVMGAWLKSAFAHLPRRWILSEAPTSITVGITHPDGERTFFTHLGHLEHLRLQHLTDAFKEVQRGDMIVLMGSFLTPALRLEYPALLETAHKLGASVVLDPGWPPEGWTGAVRNEVLGWLSTTQHLLINEVEALGLSDCADLNAASALIRSRLPATATLVIKCGSRGARVWQGDETHDLPAPTVKVVDTIGAGDTFNAGYLSGVMAGDDIAACVRKGILTASLAISTHPRQYRLAQTESKFRNPPGDL